MPAMPVAGPSIRRTPALTPLRMIGGIAVIIVVLMLPALYRRLSPGPPPATPIAHPTVGAGERWMQNIRAAVRLGPEWTSAGESNFTLAGRLDQQAAFWTGGERSRPERAISIHTGVIVGPKQTVGEFMAMSDDELIETARTYQLGSAGYAWKAAGPCGMVAGAMRRAGYCRGEYKTPGQVYNGWISTVVLSQRIVTVIYFTTRDDAEVWSEAEAVTASVRD